MSSMNQEAENTKQDKCPKQTETTKPTAPTKIKLRAQKIKDKDKF